MIPYQYPDFLRFRKQDAMRPFPCFRLYDLEAIEMNQHNFTVTDSEINFFKTFGYLSFPQLMADRITAIQDAFETVWRERGGGHNGQPHEGTARSCIVPFIDQHEELCSLLDDPRILAIAKTLLGDNFNYMGSERELLRRGYGVALGRRT